MSAIGVLKNKSILEFNFISKDKIEVKTINCIFYIIPEGDCCSTSWIEHYNDMRRDRGECIVIDILEKEMVNIAKENEFHEEIDAYFYTIQTDKGNIDIEMRNSNNGYYGGWLEVVEKDGLKDE